ncbi:MAG: hypothetical protein LBT55_00740 [Clostridiaceae bacterium]|jgi:hypothetical protein|nr:hypothetical protein [Clostridiaceae bacterium]
MAYVKKIIILNELEPGWGGVLKIESNLDAVCAVSLNKVGDISVVISDEGKITTAKPVNGQFKLPASRFSDTHCLILANGKAVAYGSTKADKNFCLSLQNYNLNSGRDNSHAKSGAAYSGAESPLNAKKTVSTSAEPKPYDEQPEFKKSDFSEAHAARFESGFEENYLNETGDGKDAYAPQTGKRFESGFEENDYGATEDAYCDTATYNAAHQNDRYENEFEQDISENDLGASTASGAVYSGRFESEFEEAGKDGASAQALSAYTDDRLENNAADTADRFENEAGTGDRFENEFEQDGANGQPFAKTETGSPSHDSSSSGSTMSSSHAPDSSASSYSVTGSSTAGSPAPGVRAQSDRGAPRRNPSLVMDDGISYEGDNFYLAVKPQLDEMFVCYPSEETLNNLVPYSRWIKVAVEDDYYVVGIVSDETGTPEFICYGIHGNFLLKPPEEIRDISEWLPLDPLNKDGDGYWLIYQSAVTGKCMKN